MELVLPKGSKVHVSIGVMIDSFPVLGTVRPGLAKVVTVIGKLNRYDPIRPRLCLSQNIHTPCMVFSLPVNSCNLTLNYWGLGSN